MIPLSKARIAGSYLCDWGYSGDPGNPGCENVALPGHTLCPAHERVSAYLEEVAAQCPEDWDEYEHGEWEPKAVPDAEFCPKGPGNRHSESWYDCEPCDYCGDDTPPESCDCGKPGHAATTIVEAQS